MTGRIFPHPQGEKYQKPPLQSLIPLADRGLTQIYSTSREDIRFMGGFSEKKKDGDEVMGAANGALGLSVWALEKTLLVFGKTSWHLGSNERTLSWLPGEIYITKYLF